MRPTPPQWAESVLALLLEPRHRQAVTGDLLEAYRDSIVPSRGQRGADRWYVRQVAGFAWRTNRLWVWLFSASYITRMAFDWLAPPQDFHLRSWLSTTAGFGILLCAGCHAAWRSQSIGAGALAGVTTTAMAAIVDALGTTVLLAFWHDAATRAAIEHSGGLAEALSLPVMLVLPGLLLGTLGGVVGGAAARLARP